MTRKIIYLVTKSNWGGAQRYVFDIAANLSKDRFTVLVVSGGEGMLTEKLGKTKIRTISLPRLRRDINFFNEIRSTVAIVKLFLREKPDIIHLNSPKAGGLGALSAFFYKLFSLDFSPRVVLTVHGWSFYEDRPRWQRILIFLSSLISCLLVNSIIVISSHDLRVARKFIRKRKIHFIPNGIDVARYRQSPSRGPRADDKMLRVGTIAELTPNKGLIYLLYAFQKIRKRSKENTELLIIGDGEDRQKLEEIIRVEHMRDILLPGFIPDAERMLSRLDVFVLPSVKEGLPYSIMEAMAYGVPVVASRVGGIPDLIEDGKTGFLVAPKDPEELAHAVETILTDKSKQDAFVSAARKKLKNEFSIAMMLEKTIKLYTS